MEPQGRIDQPLLARTWRRTRPVLSGPIAGATLGALIGGVGGRIVMRVIALIDPSARGAQTDFGTAGEITVGGTITLLVLATVMGSIGGAFYVAIRRWLPWSGVTRGISFGLLMVFGPGLIAVSETDLQIFEPALPIYAMFVALLMLYGISGAALSDRLHRPPEVRPGPRMDRAARWAVYVLAAGICFMAAMAIYRVNDGAGSCLTADGNGGCGMRAP